MKFVSVGGVLFRLDLFIAAIASGSDQVTIYVGSPQTEKPLATLDAKCTIEELHRALDLAKMS